MRVVHDPDGAGRVLASDAETADTALQQAKGLMGASSLPEGYGLVFRFDRVGRRSVHMLFVRTPLDVLWLVDDEVERVERLSPWTGLGYARADTLVELPAGAAEGVAVGDRVAVEADP